MFQQLLRENFQMLQVASTGAHYPPVDTTWKILTTGASQLTVVSLCTVMRSQWERDAFFTFNFTNGPTFFVQA